MSGRFTRPRRTKMYDCNFVAGQRYYQPVLNEVDRKYAGKTGAGLGSLKDALADAEATLGPRARASATPDGDVREQRRPLSALLDDAEGDSSPFARGGARRKLAAAMEEADADDEFFSSRRVRESRARIAALEDEISASSSLRSRKQHRNVDDFAEKVLDTVGLKNSDIGKARQFLEEDSFFKRRSKVASAEDEDTGSSKALMKWSKLSDVEESTAESAAASRARKSRARIADIDAEMEELESKAAARQRRSANVRKLLAETAELGEEADASVSTTRSAMRVKKVSATATAEKKTVTF